MLPAALHQMDSDGADCEASSRQAEVPALGGQAGAPPLPPPLPPLSGLRSQHLALPVRSAAAGQQPETLVEGSSLPQARPIPAHVLRSQPAVLPAAQLAMQQQQMLRESLSRAQRIALLTAAEQHRGQEQQQGWQRQQQQQQQPMGAPALHQQLRATAADAAAAVACGRWSKVASAVCVRRKELTIPGTR